MALDGGIGALWEWVLAPLLAAAICEAILKVLHVWGYYPDRKLVALVIGRRSPETLQRTSHWTFTALATAAALIVVVFCTMPTSKNVMGEIRNNSGVITQGQKGDNTFSSK